MLNSRQQKQLGKKLTLAHTNYAKGLNTHAFSKTSNHSTGADLVQDTFAKTWSYLVRGGKIDVMKAFLYHVLNNLIIDEYRKRKTYSLDALMDDGFEPSIDNSGSLINILDGKEALRLIEMLPQKYRLIMKMKHVKDLSITEISLITGQSKNATAVQICRGLVKLKSLYFAQEILST